MGSRSDLAHINASEQVRVRETALNFALHCGVKLKTVEDVIGAAAQFEYYLFSGDAS